MNCEFLADILDNLGRRGGRQGQHGDVGQEGADVGNLQIGGAEVVAPLGDAVGLVDGDERDPHVAQLGDEELAAKALWRHIEKLGTAEDAVLQDAQDVVVLHAAIDGSGQDALATKMADLVFHQGDERGDDDAHPFESHSGYLEGQRLAASRGHETQRVAS